MVSEKSLANLVKIDSETARAYQKKGVENRRMRKKLKEELLLLLSEGDVQKNISVALIQEAMKGNVKAFETIRDTVGEKPIERQEIREVDTNWFIEETDTEE